jgi:hypothetical protein
MCSEFRIFFCFLISQSQLSLLIFFAEYLGNSIAFVAELSGVMCAIEAVFDRGWHSLWVECDSKLTVLAFKSPNMVHWSLRNRRENCLFKTLSMNFMTNHVFREGNHCADVGLSLQDYVWWYEIPNVIKGDYSRNRLGLPFLDFASFRVRFMSPLFVFWSLFIYTSGQVCVIRVFYSTEIYKL